MTTVAEAIVARAVAFAGVPLFIIRSNDDLTTPLPEWEQELDIAQQRIPGGNITYTQILGRSPYRVTYDVLCGTHDDFRAMRAQLGNAGRLTISNIATTLDGVQELILDEPYVHLDGVLLTALSEITLENDEYVRCQASFEREADA